MEISNYILPNIINILLNDTEGRALRCFIFNEILENQL